MGWYICNTSAHGLSSTVAPPSLLVTTPAPLCTSSETTPLGGVTLTADCSCLFSP